MNKPTTRQAAWTLYAASAIAFSLATYLNKELFGALIVIASFLLAGEVILAIIIAIR